MPIGDVCNREVVIVQADDTVLDAALLMRHHHVGDVIVVENLGGRRIPVGIVTDRDLVVEIMALQLDPAAITVGDIMTPDLVTVQENTSLYDAIEQMHGKGVRRLPVVNPIGNLTGILTLDDLIELLAEEMTALARSVKLEQKKEASVRR